jgi:hypothetical protein
VKFPVFEPAAFSYVAVLYKQVGALLLLEELRLGTGRFRSVYTNHMVPEFKHLSATDKSRNTARSHAANQQNPALD